MVQIHNLKDRHYQSGLKNKVQLHFVYKKVYWYLIFIEKNVYNPYVHTLKVCTQNLFYRVSNLKCLEAIDKEQKHFWNLSVDSNHLENLLQCKFWN